MFKGRLAEIDNQSIDDTAIAYISLAVPDTPRFRNPAFHVGGLTFMREILCGLARGFGNVTAFSAVPIPAFPGCNRIFVHGEKVALDDGTVINTVPFLNITPIKQVLIGLCMFFKIVMWGLKTRRIRHRIVFSYNLSVPPILFSAMAGWLVRAKIVAFIGDIGVPGSTVARDFLFSLNHWLETEMIRLLDGLIVVSDAIANDYSDGKPFLRVEAGVTRSAIEATERYLPSAERDRDTFKIVASGSLAEYNGISIMLEAFRLLEGGHYRLAIAGRGVFGKEVQEAASKDPRIEFLGFLDYDDLLRLHASADVLLNMRLTRTLVTNYAFPSKTLEYLLSGVPLISTPAGNISSEYGKFCYLLDEETPQALAKAIRDVERLSAEERMDLGTRAREYIVKQKSWEIQCNKIAEYMRGYVLKGHPRPMEMDT
jgi:glycosyltransferase involved in cell wall biosynthesis